MAFLFSKAIKIFFLSVLILITLYQDSLAQRKQIRYSNLFYTYYYRGPLAITAGLGTAAYRGNLCGRPECNNYKPAFTVGFQYKVWPHIVFGGEAYYMTLRAELAGKNQNLSFVSNVLELRAFGRFYLNDDKIRKSLDKKKDSKKLKLFFLLGISGVYYSPFTTTITKQSTGKDTKKYTSYKGITIGIPIGGGVHYTISPRISLIGEASYITSLSDRIDNVEGESSAAFSFLDSYFLIFLKLQISPFKN